MEYQRVINLLDNTPNQPSKLITKLWVETKINQAEIITKIIQLDLKLQC